MRSIKRSWTTEYICFYRIPIERVVCTKLELKPFGWDNLHMRFLINPKSYFWVITKFCIFSPGPSSSTEARSSKVHLFSDFNDFHLHILGIDVGFWSLFRWEELKSDVPKLNKSIFEELEFTVFWCIWRMIVSVFTTIDLLSTLSRLVVNMNIYATMSKSFMFKFPEIQFKGSYACHKSCNWQKFWFRKSFYHALFKRSEISINYLIFRWCSNNFH